MRGAAVPLGIMAVLFMTWAVVAALRMGAWLSRHGVEVNWLWFRLTMPWYVHRYKTMTVELEGRSGFLYPQFVVAINAALVLAIAMIAMVVMGGR